MNGPELPAIVMSISPLNGATQRELSVVVLATVNTTGESNISKVPAMVHPEGVSVTVTS